MTTNETTITEAAAPQTKPSAKATKTRKPAIPPAKKALKATATKKLVAKPASKNARPKSEARPDTKKAIVLDLLRRKQGATTAEIAKATEWQNHSIRGFISGHVTKKMGMKVDSSRNAKGERTYTISQ